MTTSSLYPTHTIICKVPQSSSEFQTDSTTKTREVFHFQYICKHFLKTCFHFCHYGVLCVYMSEKQINLMHFEFRRYHNKMWNKSRGMNTFWRHCIYWNMWCPHLALWSAICGHLIPNVVCALALARACVFCSCVCQERGLQTDWVGVTLVGVAMEPWWQTQEVNRGVPMRRWKLSTLRRINCLE
jgi:hypothetical protein